MKSLLLASTLLFAATFSFGQTTQGQFSTLYAVGPESSCPAPTAANPTGACATPSGLEIAKAVGTPYSPLATQADLANLTSAGVTSFNKRTGPVLPVLGDYTFSLIGGQATPAQLPATSTCTLKITAVNADGSLQVVVSACK